VLLDGIQHYNCCGAWRVGNLFKDLKQKRPTSILTLWRFLYTCTNTALNNSPELCKNALIPLFAFESCFFSQRCRSMHCLQGAVVWLARGWLWEFRRISRIHTFSVTPFFQLHLSLAPCSSLAGANASTLPAHEHRGPWLPTASLLVAVAQSWIF
jgi:hypothetical protein